MTSARLPGDGEPLAGGFDHGALRRGSVVRRRAGPWSASVQHLLGYLAERDFAGAPRPLGLTGQVEEVSYLEGQTVGTARPWPTWVHSDGALDQVAHWLAAYHVAVSDYRPPEGAVGEKFTRP